MLIVTRTCKKIELEKVDLLLANTLVNDFYQGLVPYILTRCILPSDLDNSQSFALKS